MSFPVYPTLLARDAQQINGRVKLEGNQTSSLEDPSLTSFRGRKLSQVQVDELKNWDYQLSLSRSAIEQHIDKRVSHLFLQAVVCFNSGYTFEEGHTIHQGLGASAIVQDGLSIRFEAAHSATLPCIFATSPATNQKVVYLYRSGYYDEANATIDFVKQINDADSAIDGSKGCLREKTVKLLNRVSVGELNPVEISKKFADQLVLAITKVRKEKISDKLLKSVLKIYLNRAKFLRDYASYPENIDLWLNLQLDDPMLHQVAKVIEQIAQKEQVAQEQILPLIKRKIDDLPLEIFQERHQNLNKSQVPDFFHSLYYISLLRHFQGDELKIIEAALGIDKKVLEDEASRYSEREKTDELLHQQEAKIKRLAWELTPFIAALQQKEIQGSLIGISPYKQAFLRSVIYPLRYEMIRIDQEAQSRIKSKIESVFNEIKGRENACSYFYHFLLIHSKETPNLQAIFCKLLNISGFEVNQAVRELRINQDAHRYLQQYTRGLNRLAEAIRISYCNRIHRQDEIRKLLKYTFERILYVITSRSSVNSSRRLELLELLFRKRLFEQMKADDEKEFIAELLGKKEKELDGRISFLQKKAKEKIVEKLVIEQSDKIKEVVKLVLEEVKKLNEKTYEYRSKLMVKLCFSYGLSQKDLYTKMNSNYSMNDGIVISLENGLKKVDRTVISHLSAIFGVKESLFYPSHFAETAP